MVLGYALLIIFLISYRQLYWQDYKDIKTHRWIIVEIIIMVVLSIWYNPYLLLMGFFPANFIGWYQDKKYFYYALAGFSASLIISFVCILLLQPGVSFLYFIPFLVIMITSPFGIKSMFRSMELEKKLDQANEQIKELVKREERVRIARDLHDTLGHTLSLITLQSQLVQKLLEIDGDQARVKAKEIEVTSRAALKQVRELVSDMRSISIKEELADIRKILQEAGISYSCEGEEMTSDIPLLQQNILGMCLREAATNIVKHSHASNCRIQVKKERGYFVICVSDNGHGFTPQQQEGNGLKGIKERLAIVEGELFIHSVKGTSLLMKVPIVKAQEKEGIA
ncbi:sensor histidine kinase [Siminovitchia sediminis]|uniref:histidine kinase n=1 Tax=Siminovitchia sediminis TaxID=1274353 RepID=A0ABW4KPP2_9BACI